MSKKPLFILIPLFLFISVVVVNGKDTVDENGEWHMVGMWNGSFYNSSGSSAPDFEDWDERKIEPAPQPVLDLSSSRIFYITTLAISLIVLFIILNKILLLNTIKSERLETPSDTFQRRGNYLV